MSNGNLHGPLGKQISSLGSHTWYITSNPSQSTPTTFGIEPSSLLYANISNQKLQEHIDITFNKQWLWCWGFSDHLQLPNLTALFLSSIWKGSSFSLCSEGAASYVSLPSICSICTMVSIKDSVFVLPVAVCCCFAVHDHSKSEGRVIIELHHVFTPRLQKLFLALIIGASLLNMSSDLTVLTDRVHYYCMLVEFYSSYFWLIKEGKILQMCFLS